METPNTVIEHLTTADLHELLPVNPGLILIKFGATWCGPCKKVDAIIDEYFKVATDRMVCAKLDVDDNIDLYGYMKKKRIVNGIPVIICYVKGNVEIWPSDSITGANIPEIHRFFARCKTYLHSL